ncbi:MAG: mechanosensitive ion channel [Muribaculaceae bacterium]|nr:mechanosensitive ion channel [Muribaculaceae bacterium]
MIPVSEELITATDSIPSVKQELQMLRTLPFDELMDSMVKNMVHFAVSLAVAILVFYVGKFIIRKLYSLVAGIMIRRNVDRSLSTFVLSLIRIVLYFILIVTVIGILGINTSSFIALFASAGVAIGMALSGTLQNFAGGVLILLLKPYKIGDYIEAQGFAGTVTEIQIFHTIICTPDNKSIIIPNGGLSTGSINNWSREDYRRVEWTVAISYGDSVSTARQAILGMFASDSRIVRESIENDRREREQAEEATAAATAQATEPEELRHRSWLYRLFHRRHADLQTRLEAMRIEEETKIKAFTPDVDRRPTVTLGELADSSINLTIRAWVRSRDYWGVYYEFNERFYNELPTHGLTFPFPQLDVHLPAQEN